MSNDFSTELAWSLSPINTSVVVALLSGVWPSARWVTCVTATDVAGCDLLGERDGLSPILIDAKFRHVPPERRRWFQADDPDALLDVEYRSNDGQRRPGPVKRYGGNQPPPPADFYCYVYPDQSPPVGLLVDARAAHHWLSYDWDGLKLLHSETTRADGLTWRTSFVAAPGSLLNARAGHDTARLLTLNSSGSVMVSLP
jgi:hypothetical protein